MRLFFILCILTIGFTLGAQNRMNSSETSYLYDLEHEFLIDHQVASKDGQHKVYIKFVLNSGNVKISDYVISYDLRTNYTTEKGTNSSVSIDSTNIEYTGFREFIFKVDLDETTGKNLMVIDVYNIPKNRRFNYDIPLSIDGKVAPPFLPYEPELDIPFFDAYLNQGDKFRLKDVFDGEGNFEITGHKNTADVPVPPFDETERAQVLKTPLDTLYGVQQNEVFTFHNEGFYKINSSKNRNQSRYLFVSDPFYPYFDDYKELVRPLIFLSTNTEYQAMQEAEDSRAGFERFIQNTVSGNQQVAKDFIKYYFRRIRNAGKLFTEDREGWKTDRGMIYLIFGNPLQVLRNEKTELWVYASGSGGRLRFIFDIIENEGVTKFSLIRGSRYKEGWMTAVTQWRAGRIIE